MEAKNPNDYEVYKKRLINPYTGKEYNYYYSIWWDDELDKFDLQFYSHNMSPLKMNYHNRSAKFQIMIDGKLVSVRKSAVNGDD